MPDALLIIVIISSLFALGAAVKAAWHAACLRAAGETPVSLMPTRPKDK